LKRVLFDSDVLLDVLLQRQPFFVASAQALDTVAQQKIKGYISGHAVTNIFYILRRQVGNQVARDLVAELLEKIEVASVTDEVIRLAINSEINDFEDAVTSASAIIAQLEVIITRNTSDFTNSLVPGLKPEEFLRMILTG
jgi:predicted nucleic-acid-binding protein